MKLNASLLTMVIKIHFPLVKININNIFTKELLFILQQVITINMLWFILISLVYTFRNLLLIFLFELSFFLLKEMLYFPLKIELFIMYLVFLVILLNLMSIKGICNITKWKSFTHK